MPAPVRKRSSTGRSDVAKADRAEEVIAAGGVRGQLVTLATAPDDYRRI